MRLCLYLLPACIALLCACAGEQTTVLQETLTPDDSYTLAEQGVTRNADWTPYIESFDGVRMALVPRGCFMMGSDEFENEQPIHEQCLDTPFWIDVTEVTNAAYGSAGVFEGDNIPRGNVSWSAARDFCASRGAGVRLPTEREWEYAARGVDNLIYPWGNAFIQENVAADQYGSVYPREVGSHPNGASWVGALDMSGSVAEWVSSLNQMYPYDPDDERESMDDVFGQSRITRGGGFNDPPEMARAARRFPLINNRETGSVGFRCVRNF
jgi:iron(II)-dependent oxidoreductase